MPPVKIYSTAWCGYCRAAKSFFKERKVPFEEIDLTNDDEARVQLQERTGRNTVPQIYIGEHHVGGYDDLRALDRAGKLQALLSP